MSNYPRSQQRSSHHQLLYKQMARNNFQIYQSLTDNQKDIYWNMWETEMKIQEGLSEDYPDALAYEISRNRTLKLVKEQE